MIIKELDPFYGKTSWDIAGHKAEENMAFYLKRRFYDSKKLFVINNLRFPWLDSYVQIDHLVLCRYGASIIESKSVRHKVMYEGEQWFRYWDDDWIGMKNPVLQAEEQGRALLDLLDKNYKSLLGKMLGLVQKGFGYMPIHCFVAISDTGMFIPPRTNNLYKEQVFKADTISDKIISDFKHLKQVNSAFKHIASGFTIKYEPWDMTDNELKRVIDFLLSVHVPYTPNDILPQETEDEEVNNSPQENLTIQSTFIKQETSIPMPSFTETSTPMYSPAFEPLSQQAEPQPTSSTDNQTILTYDSCPYCGGKISILWGAKYKSYYWHCDACGKNISINYKCPKCHEKLRIQKIGDDYYIYCIICGLQEHFFTDKK